MDLTLEQIADKILDGTMSLRKAKELVNKGFGIRRFPVTENPQKEYSFSELDGELTLRIQDRIVAKIVYLVCGGFEEKYLQLISAESYEQGKGYFSYLFKQLEKLGKRENCSHISLEVDVANPRAQEIYRRKGCYDLGCNGSAGDNVDRIHMRKDL